VIQLNRRIEQHERERRLADYYRPYHRRIDRALRESPRAAILSVHTFTPVYEGEARSLEIGVLFEQNPALGELFAAELSARGWRTALNEPYSGAQGFAFSPEDHGARHRRPALELEIRQDLALDQDSQAKLVDDLVAATRRTYDIDP